MKQALNRGETLLFIGDSITDAGRREDADGLGFGYVRYFHDMLFARHPGCGIQVLNRGIGGDTIRHLDARWETDVIAEKPDVLSISIGVNDVWRQLQSPGNPEEVLIDEFTAIYRKLLDRTREAVGCRLLLLEPTIIGEEPDAPHNRLMQPYLDRVADLAKTYDATLVPLNRAFHRAIAARPEQQWTTDGVHPLTHGHMLMALGIVDVLGGLDACVTENGP